INIYGDPVPWSIQKTGFLTFLSFLNVCKYPPSLLYLLMTLGPAMIFLGLTEGVKTTWSDRIRIFGPVPMFYYLAHLFLIHLLPVPGPPVSIHTPGAMFFISNRLPRIESLKGYGFNLFTVYLVWLAVILLLYPLSKRFDQYKREHQST